MSKQELKEKLVNRGLAVPGPELEMLLELFDTYSTKDIVNRLEVINHLSDGSGREVVVWKGEPFEAVRSIQDDGRTLKIFLTDIQSTPKEKIPAPKEAEEGES